MEKQGSVLAAPAEGAFQSRGGPEAPPPSDLL